jgi:hypothetical protein
MTLDRAKIEISKTVKFTNGDGEIKEKTNPIIATKLSKPN